MVNSEGVAARYRPILGKAAAKIRVIYNGVDTARFDRAPYAAKREEIRRLEMHVPAGAPVVVNVANLLPVKNHGLLLRAWARVHEGRGAATRPYLLLLGDGPEKEGIFAEAARLGLLPYLRVLGRVGDVERYLAASDVFALSSHAEGFSNALVEAMASGLACVATDVGGNAEALAGGAGVVVPPGDEDAFAAALAALVDDEARRRELGATARARAVVSFGMERMVEETERWYRELLGARR